MLTEHDVEKKLASLGPDHPNRVQLEILRRLIRIDQALAAKDDVLAKDEPAASPVLADPPSPDRSSIRTWLDDHPAERPPRPEFPPNRVITEGGTERPDAAPVERVKGKGRRR